MNITYWSTCSGSAVRTLSKRSNAHDSIHTQLCDRSAAAAAAFEERKRQNCTLPLSCMDVWRSRRGTSNEKDLAKEDRERERLRSNYCEQSIHCLFLICDCDESTTYTSCARRIFNSIFFYVHSLDCGTKNHG